LQGGYLVFGLVDFVYYSVYNLLAVVSSISIMIEIFIINLVLFVYLFYKENKNSQTIREILASKFSQETFEKVVNPQKEETETNIASEPLLDDIDAEELAKKLQGSIEE